MLSRPDRQPCNSRVMNKVGTNSVSLAADRIAASGLMVRESLSGNAANAFMALRPVVCGTAGGTIFGSRSATSGSTSLKVSGDNSAAPYWLKLVRSGSNFTGCGSLDGGNWIKTGSVSLSMASSAYVGFAVTRSNAAYLATAQFDNISITGADTPVVSSISVSPAACQMEPGWTSQFAVTANNQYGKVQPRRYPPIQSQSLRPWRRTGSLRKRSWSAWKTTDEGQRNR